LKVLKFGGSSLADALRIRKVADIILDEVKSGLFALVLSAMKGITNHLVQAAELAERGNPDYHTLLRSIKQTHDHAVKELFPEEKTKIIHENMEQLHKELEDFLHGVELIRECTPRILDLVMSFGERLSCTLVTHYLNERGMDALFVDARKLIVTDDMYGKASVDYDETYARIKKLLQGMKKVPVITGFIAATKNKVTTTLGRNGSDYTASLIGAGLNVGAIEIWTDVNGVLSADPRYVKNAFTIHELSYEEAMELSYFGAEVIHPNTMIPAVERNIPIIIKNTFDPHAAGTIIKNKIKTHETAISGIACIEDVALLNIEGGGMIGIPGMAARIFSILASATLNIIMISQGSSEHSICLALKQNETLKAVETLKRELKRELENKIINEFLPIRELVIIAVIGDNMRGTPGISGKLFSALGREQVNVLAIAQGSSERNISFVVHNNDRVRALNTIHRAFFNDYEMRK
jgi:aspartokinase/homoserine dehydrogenase 1